MRLLSFILLLTLSSFAFASQEILTEQVRVIFDGEELEPYAGDIAEQAEAALAALEPLFGVPDGRVTINLETSTDIYNAFALPLPRPSLRLRTLFPNGGYITFAAEDDLFMLLVHELTHTLQLGYTERPDGSAGLRLGLVGQNVARLPPYWFVEGIATWTESEYGGGGRRDDARTVALVEQLALGENWPSLEQLNIRPHRVWPAGFTPYLVGVRFVDHLITEHGLDTMLAALRSYNAGGFLGDFSAAWAAQGVDLAAEWKAFEAVTVAAAEARVSASAQSQALTNSGWYTSSPAFSPDGSSLAWVSWPPAVVVAEYDPNFAADLADATPQAADTEANPEKTEAALEPRIILKDSSLVDLDWLNSDTLLYARSVRRPGTTYNELFSLDVESGEEKQLTSGARAQFARATPEGCILYVRDFLPEGSSLRRWCEDGASLVWQAPENAHIVGLDVSESGRVALSLWRRGEVDIALLENGQVSQLTQDPFQDLSPRWQGERLIFSSDRSGHFELYALDPRAKSLQQLTRAAGGAFNPAAAPGKIVYVTLGEGGYDLVVGPPENLADEQISVTLTAEPDSPDTTDTFSYTLRPYSPWSSLAPYGWLPAYADVSLSPLGGGFGASLFGQDHSGVHSYAITGGYDTRLPGYLAGAFANIAYAHSSSLFGLFDESPTVFSARAGLWPHAGHLSLEPLSIAAGFDFGVSLRLPQDRWVNYGFARAGLLSLPSRGGVQLDAAIGASTSKRRTDNWDYVTRGPNFGVTGVVSATGAGPSLGLWADASYYRPLGRGVAEFAVRSGYRQAPQLPIRLNELAAVGTLGYRYSIPAKLSYSRWTLRR